MAYNVITQEAEQHTEIVFSENESDFPLKIELDPYTKSSIHITTNEEESYPLVCSTGDLDNLIQALQLAKEWGWLSEQQEELE